MLKALKNTVQAWELIDVISKGEIAGLARVGKEDAPGMKTRIRSIIKKSILEVNEKFKKEFSKEVKS